MEYSIGTPEEMLEFAKKLGEQAKPGQVFALVGDLGVGKTVFVKGFALGLGISAHVTSPTFNLVKEYQGRLPMYHFDVYRISDESEMFEIGFEEYLAAPGVTLIEWADLIPDLLPPHTVQVRIERAGEGGRKVTLHSPVEGDTL